MYPYANRCDQQFRTKSKCGPEVGSLGRADTLRKRLFAGWSMVLVRSSAATLRVDATWVNRVAESSITRSTTLMLGVATSLILPALRHSTCRRNRTVRFHNAQQGIAFNGALVFQALGNPDVNLGGKSLPKREHRPAHYSRGI